ncbi:hypothetical protein Dimus_009959 [Dionaea muscipula]
MGKVYKLDLCLSSSSPKSDHRTRTLFKAWYQPYTIVLYNGRVCFCDTIELQAKTIIWRATRELEPTLSTLSSQFRLQNLRGPSIMRRSLQLFLQRRKKRRTSKQITGVDHFTSKLPF